MKLLPLAAGLAAVVLLPGGAVEAQHALALGRVIDDATGEPLGGSVVELLGVRSRTVRSIVTDEQGFFRLEVRPGVHQLRARSRGFLTSRPTEVAFPFEYTLHLEIRLSRGSVLLAPIEIVPPPGPLSLAPPQPR